MKPQDRIKALAEMDGWSISKEFCYSLYGLCDIANKSQTLMNKTGLHCTALLTHFALARGLVKNLFADEPNA